MPNILELKRRRTELANECSKALSDLEHGRITRKSFDDDTDRKARELATVDAGIKAYGYGLFQFGSPERVAAHPVPPFAGQQARRVWDDPAATASQRPGRAALLMARRGRGAPFACRVD
jgi:hypothetical protein